MEEKGLSNPAVAAALAPAANTAVKGAGDFISKNAKPILLAAGATALVVFGPKAYRNYRAKKYANANIGNPNLVAASIIFASFKRFKFPGFIGLFVPDINISTDEDSLNRIASDPKTHIKEVARAYKILFQRNLAQDVQQGLSTKELRTFYSLLQSKPINDDKTLYPIGSTLFVAKKPHITVNEATKQGNSWKGTSFLFGNFNFNEKVGKVIANGIWNGENYYIVEKCGLGPFFCNTGVVLQHQVTNEKK